MNNRSVHVVNLLLCSKLVNTCKGFERQKKISHYSIMNQVQASIAKLSFLCLPAEAVILPCKQSSWPLLNLPNWSCHDIMLSIYHDRQARSSMSKFDTWKMNAFHILQQGEVKACQNEAHRTNLCHNRTINCDGVDYALFLKQAIWSKYVCSWSYALCGVVTSIECASNIEVPFFARPAVQLCEFNAIGFP